MIDGQDQVQSGAGYGDGGMNTNAGADAPGVGGGLDSSGGTGSTGGEQVADHDSEQQQGDQAVQRSETIEAEDVEFEADEDLIEDDDE